MGEVKMILLTDEEIRNELNAMLSVPDDDLPTAYEVIAKAQLKKVIEWLEKGAEYDISYRAYKFGIAKKTWQALLDEVK